MVINEMNSLKLWTHRQVCGTLRIRPCQLVQHYELSRGQESQYLLGTVAGFAEHVPRILRYVLSEKAHKSVAGRSATIAHGPLKVIRDKVLSLICSRACRRSLLEGETRQHAISKAVAVVESVKGTVEPRIQLLMGERPPGSPWF